MHLCWCVNVLFYQPLLNLIQIIQSSIFFSPPTFSYIWPKVKKRTNSSRNINEQDWNILSANICQISGSDDVIFVFTPFLFSHLSTDSVFPTFTNTHIFYDNFIMSETCACVHVCIFMCYVCSCVCPCACGCVTIYFIYKHIFHIHFINIIYFISIIFYIYFMVVWPYISLLNLYTLTFHYLPLTISCADIDRHASFI